MVSVFRGVSSFSFFVLLACMCLPLFAQDDSDWDSDFESWETVEDSSDTVGESDACETATRRGPSAEKIAGVTFSIVATILAGIAIRFQQLHILRPIILLLSVGFLGFFLGGCPCPIKGFESLLSILTGEHLHRMPLIMLGATLLLTPIVGPVWCGWVCHLGGLQEFLHRKKLIPAPGSKVSHTFLWIRRVAGVSYILWILLAAKPFWEPIDPFRSAFNLIVTSPISWALLIVMLLSSLFIYRPFCRTLCPVGMVVGEISRLPFAAKIRVSNKCHHCKRCSEVCGMGAIHRGEITTANCIACGECMDPCRKDAIALKFSKKDDGER